MKTVLSTAYFPPISYFLALIDAEQVCIEAHEHYQKQSFRNRAYIQTASGLQALSVPIIKTQGNHTPIQEVGICERTPWRDLHFKALCTAYNQSPFFQYYKDELKELIGQNYCTLWNLNQAILSFLINKFKLKVEIEYSLSYENNASDFLDLRGEILHPKKPSLFEIPCYYHLFGELSKQELEKLSILDYLFNEGVHSL